MASPPTTIVPLSVVIAKGRILSTAERGTVEVIINRHIASTIIGEVSCPVAREVSIAIHRYIAARTINLRVSRPIDRDISLAINGSVSCPVRRDISLAINGSVSCPIRRDISLAINNSVVSRSRLLVPRGVSLAIRAHPGVLLGHRV
jgi:hypothetical protein